MTLFSRDIARIYVDEVRKRMDRTVVPVFPPDTELDVGDTVTLEDGRLNWKSSLKDRTGIHLDVHEYAVAGQEFGSASKVSLGPSVAVAGPLGGQLVKATLFFAQGRSVAASFRPGTERRARDIDAFGADLMRLWMGDQLKRNRWVVAAVRRSAGGTVIVSEEGDNQIDVLADAGQLGPAGLTVADLAVGVTFGKERKLTWKISDPAIPLVWWVRLLRLDRKQRQVIDGYGFQPERAATDPALQRPTTVTASDMLELM